MRDQVVDFMNRWADKTEIAVGRLVAWAGLARSKFFDWKDRYGKVNEHNVWIPRDHWLEDSEKKAIIAFHQQNPLEGYRRLTFMMLDQDIVAVKPFERVPGAGPGRSAGQPENGSRPKRAPALSNRWPRMSIGMWTCPTSIFAALFTISAASWMAAAASSCIGKFASK